MCQTGQSSRNNHLAADERQVQEVERTVSGHLAECNVVDAKLVGARQDLRVGMNTSCYLTQNDAVRKHVHLRTPHAMAKWHKETNKTRKPLSRTEVKLTALPRMLPIATWPITLTFNHQSWPTHMQKIQVSRESGNRWTDEIDQSLCLSHYTHTTV